MRTAAQPSPLPKSNASAGLLAQILVSTFADHLPLNRQEAIFKRHGAHLPRATLCEWKLAAAELLAVLRPALKAHILAAPRVHSDDTTMPLQEAGRGGTSTARLWDYLGAGQREENGLWPGLASAALAWIARLYAIERTIRDLTQDQKLRQRQEHSVPPLADFRRWLDAHVPQLVPQSPLAQAFGYALRNWEALVRYTESGVLAPDNNAIEQAIRPIAAGRSNYLFAGSARGGRAAATMYSLIGTARLNGINPHHWLKDVLARRPSYPINRVAELLPLPTYHWA